MPTIVIEFANGKKKGFPVVGELLGIGRKPDNPIHVPDPYVSGRHAELRRMADGGYELVDLGSHNGTEVNGSRVSGPVALRDGDHLSFGGITGTFRLADPGGPAPVTESTSVPPKTGTIPPATTHAPTRRIPSLALTPAPLQPPPPELVAANQQLRAARDELAAARKSLEGVQTELENARKELAEATAGLEDLRRAKAAEVAIMEERCRVAREQAEEARAGAARHHAAAGEAEVRMREVRELTEKLRREEKALTERLQILHRQQFLLEQRSRETSPSQA
ncbi:MAG: FHA domain-containing protein [Verrucomicrobia bacterium]|nr:FHA domain-containing protein [Verrucomicrobiota bacterium]